MKKYWRYWICFCLMMKRMLKKKAFLLLLISLPLLSMFITRLERNADGSTGIIVGIVMESESGSGSEDKAEDRAEDKAEYKTGNETQAQQKMRDRFLSVLTESDSVIQFQVYGKQSNFLRDIQKGDLDCGVILPADIWERIMTDEWKGSVIVYKTSSSSMTEIVKERIASSLFTVYSEESYVNYVEHTDAFYPAKEQTEEIKETEEKGSVDMMEERVSFAHEAYETHLVDGSTFAFEYYGEEYDEEKNEETHDEAYMAGENGRQPVSKPFFSLRGVLAVCIFLSGLCGLLTDWQDRQDRRFVRILPNAVTTAVNVWIPTIYTSALTLLSYVLTGQLGGIGKELWNLIFYQFLIVVYCSIIRLLLRKQETIAAAIPILTLACIICCPVWIRLASYLPIFRVLEKLFPATYYLM